MQNQHINKANKAQITQCFLGLGGNITNELGTPQQHIISAVKSLKKHPKISHVQMSSLYESEPFGVTDQPNFINAVVAVQTTLTALQLLDVCQWLEQNAKRERLRHWGERSLDVDILLYGNHIINTPRLTVPHAGILERNFVLVPLAELDSSLNIKDTPIADLPLSKDWTGLKLLN